MDRYGDFFYFFPFHVGNVLKWHGKNFKFDFSIEMFSILEKYFSFFFFYSSSEQWKELEVEVSGREIRDGWNLWIIISYILAL